MSTLEAQMTHAAWNAALPFDMEEEARRNPYLAAHMARRATGSTERRRRWLKMNLVHEGVLDPNEPDFRDEKREEEEAQEARQKRETLSVDELADKVSEIAAIIHTDEFHEESHDLERLADEIKEAWKREVVSKTETTTFCNVAAILDVLKTIHDKLNSLDEECGVDPVEIRDIARAALAEPARNCDVGTEFEQVGRFKEFCHAHFCDNCPCRVDEIDPSHYETDPCPVIWAQLPYEAQEGGAE